jgi:hypothetical protein
MNPGLYPDHGDLSPRIDASGRRSKIKKLCLALLVALVFIGIVLRSGSKDAIVKLMKDIFNQNKDYVPSKGNIEEASKQIATIETQDGPWSKFGIPLREIANVFKKYIPQTPKQQPKIPPPPTGKHLAIIYQHQQSGTRKTAENHKQQTEIPKPQTGKQLAIYRPISDDWARKCLRLVWNAIRESSPQDAIQCLANMSMKALHFELPDFMQNLSMPTIEIEKCLLPLLVVILVISNILSVRNIAKVKKEAMQQIENAQQKASEAQRLAITSVQNLNYDRREQIPRQENRHRVIRERNNAISNAKRLRETLKLTSNELKRTQDVLDQSQQELSESQKHHYEGTKKELEKSRTIHNMKQQELRKSQENHEGTKKELSQSIKNHDSTTKKLKNSLRTLEEHGHMEVARLQQTKNPLGSILKRVLNYQADARMTGTNNPQRLRNTGRQPDETIQKDNANPTSILAKLDQSVKNRQAQRELENYIEALEQLGKREEGVQWDYLIREMTFIREHLTQNFNGVLSETLKASLEKSMAAFAIRVKSRVQENKQRSTKQDAFCKVYNEYMEEVVKYTDTNTNIQNKVRLLTEKASLNTLETTCPRVI